MRFFALPFCTRLAEGAESLQDSIPPDVLILRKFRPNRFRFVGVISEKKRFRAIAVRSAYNDVHVCVVGELKLISWYDGDRFHVSHVDDVRCGTNLRALADSLAYWLLYQQLLIPFLDN